MAARLLGSNDEPQDSGAIVAVNYGDYRQQEVWINSGANIGNWYCLGNEYSDWVPMQRRPDLPDHPEWRDVLARGPVTLLVPGEDDAYRQGWRNGRRDLWQRMEDLTYDGPEGAS